LSTWIAVDWGTSFFRAYLIKNDFVSDKIETNDGMKFIKNGDFESKFISLTQKWLSKNKKIDVLASGMIGARQGWMEAPYEKTPCNLNSLNYVAPLIKDNRLSLKIFSGVSQNNPPDVMRGEETQVAGFFNQIEHFNGSICLPGTHSKWIKVNNNFIEKFKTYMSGELFQVISENTVLLHSLKSQKIDNKEFLNSANKIFQNPEYLTNALFQIRADDLINSRGPVIYKSRLSGYLLGIELLGAKEFWENCDVVLIGSENVMNLYEKLLEDKTLSLKKFSAEEMVLQGLKSFRKNLMKS
jgi:2-dehydro-3-deoxygalactonokinase